jgi:hypothetical protein
VLVTIVRAGGLAGLVRQTELDSAVLPPDAAVRLRRLVEAVSWEPPPSTAGPDELRYELTVVDDEVTWSVRTSDQGLAEPERLLIAFVDGRPERVDRVERL